jgi:hypothetical protein
MDPGALNKMTEVVKHSSEEMREDTVKVEESFKP